MWWKRVGAHWANRNAPADGEESAAPGGRAVLQCLFCFCFVFKETLHLFDLVPSAKNNNNAYSGDLNSE